MKYGTLQTVEDEAAATAIEPDAKNLCVRAAWAAGFRPTGKPEAKARLTELGWLLRILVDVEPRNEPTEEGTEEDTDDVGFA